MLRVKKRRIHHQPPIGIVHNGQRKRVAVAAVDNLAKHISAFVAVKRRVEHLHMQVHFLGRPIALKMLPRCAQNIADVFGGVGERHLPAEMLENIAQAVAQALFAGVKRAEGGRVGIDIFRADGRLHKDKLIVVILFGQKLGRHRIEKRFRQFGLLVVDQKRDIFDFRRRPHFIAQGIGRVLVAQRIHRLAHALVIHLDALGHQILNAAPIACFKQTFGARGDFAVEAVVLVKAGEHGFRHRPALNAGELLPRHNIFPLQRGRLFSDGLIIVCVTLWLFGKLGKQKAV